MSNWAHRTCNHSLLCYGSLPSVERKTSTNSWLMDVDSSKYGNNRFWPTSKSDIDPLYPRARWQNPMWNDQGKRKKSAARPEKAQTINSWYNWITWICLSFLEMSFPTCIWLFTQHAMGGSSCSEPCAYKFSSCSCGLHSIQNCRFGRSSKKEPKESFSF